MPGEVYRIYLDAGKARRELGWEPRISLEAGLRDTVEYFRGQVVKLSPK
jgi:nucleoside-diphosphate-sugar epimerase